MMPSFGHRFSSTDFKVRDSGAKAGFTAELVFKQWPESARAFQSSKRSCPMERVSANAISDERLVVQSPSRGACMRAPRESYLLNLSCMQMRDHKS